MNWMNDYKPEMTTGWLSDLPDNVQAGVLGAGRETDKVLRGAEELFYRLTGDEVKRGDIAKEQAYRDQAFAPVEDEHFWSTLGGSVVPYLATGAFAPTRAAGKIGMGAAEGGLYYQPTMGDRAINAGMGGALSGLGDRMAPKLGTLNSKLMGRLSDA